MKSHTNLTRSDEALHLNVFCAQEGKALRVYLGATRFPEYLRDYFDRHGEAYPVLLDLEDLDRYMAKQGVEYQQRVSKAGGVELSAHGRAAAVLATWLSRSFASGVRLNE